MSWTRGTFMIKDIGIMGGPRVVRKVAMIMVLVSSMSVAAAPDIKTVSIAEGFGAGAAGGRGGRVITVTNLNDSGPGSLRDALSAGGPRIIRFAAEGIIRLNSPLVVTQGRLTLDGGTAPGLGVTVMHHGIHIRGDCKDIIIRHLRIRVTTGAVRATACFSGAWMGELSSVCSWNTALSWGRPTRLSTPGDRPGISPSSGR